MKSMLYLGVVLMIGACVYGFVDYKKATRNKEFKSLYNETAIKKTEPEVAAPAPAPVNDNKEITIEDGKKPTAIAASEKKVISKRKIKAEKKLNYKLFSRAPLKEFKAPPEVIKEETKQ